MPIGSGSDEDMIKWGWSKTLRYGHIYFAPNGRTYLKVYDFDAKRISCLTCGSSDFTWVSIAPSGVYWACGNCRICEGPLSLEQYGILRERLSKEVSLKEAIDICRETGQRIPKQFVKLARTRRRREYGIEAPAKIIGVPQKKKKAPVKKE